MPTTTKISSIPINSAILSELAIELVNLQENINNTIRQIALAHGGFAAVSRLTGVPESSGSGSGRRRGPSNRFLKIAETIYSILKDYYDSQQNIEFPPPRFPSINRNPNPFPNDVWTQVVRERDIRERLEGIRDMSHSEAAEFVEQAISENEQSIDAIISGQIEAMQERILEQIRQRNEARREEMNATRVLELEEEEAHTAQVVELHKEKDRQIFESSRRRVENHIRLLNEQIRAEQHAAIQSMIIQGISGVFNAAVSGVGVAPDASTGGQGSAHGGLDFVPREGTYLLDRGEAVLQPRANVELMDFLSRERRSGMGGDVNVSIINNAPVDIAQGETSVDAEGNRAVEFVINTVRSATQTGELDSMFSSNFGLSRINGTVA